MNKEKEYIAIIDIKEFIELLQCSGVLESLFISKTKFNDLTHNQYNKSFNRNNVIDIEFYNDKTKVIFNRIILKSMQKKIIYQLKRKGNNAKN